MISVFNKIIEIQLVYVNITGVPRIFPFIFALMPSRAVISLLLLGFIVFTLFKYACQCPHGLQPHCYIISH